MNFALKNVVSNPFRDLQQFPLSQRKIDKLANSIRKTGWWENIPGRIVNGQLQLAHGHHRLAALRSVLGEDATAEFIVQELSDDAMLKMMAAENDEDWGGDLRSVIETVKATVQALADRRVILCVDPKTQKHNLRYAPSFIAGIKPCRSELPDIPYSATALAEYLTYVKRRDSDTWTADDKVLAALNVLELIELGIYKKNQLNDERYQSDRGIVKVDYVLRETRDLRERARDTLVRAKQATTVATEQARIAQAQIEKHRQEHVTKKAAYDADVQRIADLTREADEKEVERLLEQSRERKRKDEENKKDFKEKQDKLKKKLAEDKKAQAEAEKKEKAARTAAIALVPKKDSESNVDYNPTLTSAIAFLNDLPAKSVLSTVRDKSLLKPGQLENLRKAFDEAIIRLQAARSKL